MYMVHIITMTSKVIKGAIAEHFLICISSLNTLRLRGEMGEIILRYQQKDRVNCQQV